MSIIKRKGFTLVELLVVVAIVGILVSLVLASLSGAKAASRDKKRVANLAQLQFALEQYYDANSNTVGYPKCASATSQDNVCGLTGGTGNLCASNPSGSQVDFSNFSEPLAPYLTSIPVDPINSSGSTGYTYYYVRCCRMTDPVHVACYNPSYTAPSAYPSNIIPTSQDYVLLTRLENPPTGTQSITFWSWNGTSGVYSSAGYSGINNSNLNYLIGSGQN